MLQLVCSFGSYLLRIHLSNHPGFVLLVLLLGPCSIGRLFSFEVCLLLCLCSFKLNKVVSTGLSLRGHLQLELLLQLFVSSDLSLVGEIGHISSDLLIGQGANIVTEASLSSSWQWVSELLVVASDVSSSPGDLGDGISALQHLVEGGSLSIILVGSVDNITQALVAGLALLCTESWGESGLDLAEALFPVLGRRVPEGCVATLDLVLSI
jgi:hypothetical protein